MEKIKIIELEYKGNPIRVENGKVFLRAFGTTINNHSMHYSWMEVKVSDLKTELKDFLIKHQLLLRIE